MSGAVPGIPVTKPVTKRLNLGLKRQNRCTLSFALIRCSFNLLRGISKRTRITELSLKIPCP